MMKKRFLSIFFMCLAVYTSTSLLTAQNVELDLGFCGTNELSPDMRTWLGNHQQNPDKPNYRNYKNGNYEYLPVQFHVVGDSQGEGYFPRTSMYRLLCEVNDQFSESDLQFFMYDDFNYLNNDDWYEHNFGQGYEMMDANNVDDVINIYMVDDPAGNCGYFSPSVDGIAVAKMCADAGSGTTAHEIGHYLSMPHTFSGWEGHDYFTDPINENQWEKVDGSNCLFRGDGFCDTPPDYVSDRWNCPYTLDLFDTNGEPVNPDGTLYMSYSNDGCSARFSEEQKDAMLAYVYEVRSYLLNADVPEIESVQNTYAHFPASGTQEVPYENVLLTWKAAEGASEYYLNLKQFAEEEGISVQTTVTDTFYVVTLTPDVQYYYWVKPLNAGNTCGEQGEGNFTTSSTSVLYASNVEVSMVGCHEGNDGYIFVEMEGGIPPYKFEWSNGYIDDYDDEQVSSSVMDLEAGTYKLTVTDSASVVNTNVLRILVPEPDGMDIDVRQTDNLAANVRIDGGVVPYTIEWSSGEVGNQAYGLVFGENTVTITDGNGCAVVDSFKIFAIDEMVNDISCYGEIDGNIDFELAFGAPPYDYTWSTGSTDTALHDLEIGQYSVTITDAENNYFSKSYFIDEPTELVLYLDVEGNEVQAAVLGGTQPYSFDWPLGDDVNTAIIPISGFFNVVVTDARGCEISQFFEIQTTVGISETIAQNIRVYPTFLPSNQNLQLELDLLQQSEVIAEVYNSAGQQVWLSAYSLGVGKHLQSISSPQFNTGLHLVKLQINGETITKKFVVE